MLEFIQAWLSVHKRDCSKLLIILLLILLFNKLITQVKKYIYHFYFKNWLECCTARHLLHISQDICNSRISLQTIASNSNNRISVAYGQQILRSSWPYLDSVTIWSWIINTIICMGKWLTIISVFIYFRWWHFII